MTYQDHARIAVRFIERGTVSRADQRILEANDPLGNPLGPILGQAIRHKVEGLIQYAKRRPVTGKAQIRKFANSPLGAAFIQS